MIIYYCALGVYGYFFIVCMASLLFADHPIVIFIWPIVFWRWIKKSTKERLSE